MKISVVDVIDLDSVNMKPHAVPIVLANNDHTFTLDEEALKKVLLRDEIKDRFVVVISVAGAFRHGKSFLLDFFLRYLNSKVNTRFAFDTVTTMKSLISSMYLSKTRPSGWALKTPHLKVSRGEVAQEGTPLGFSCGLTFF